MRHADVGTRLLVVGAFRTSPPGAPRPPIRNLAERLPAQRVVHRRLGPLTAEDVAEWLAHRLPGAAPPAGFLEWLIAETGGQPGALEASLASLIERGVVRETDDGWVIETDRAALDAADAGGPDLDLSRLGDAPADTVRAASIFGDRFDGDELARVLALDELVVEDHLAVAARFGLIEVVGTVDRPGGDIATAYRFASSSARAALQRALPRESRLRLQAALDAARGPADKSGARMPPGEAVVTDRSDAR
jgi:predicted ATPase